LFYLSAGRILAIRLIALTSELEQPIRAAIRAMLTSVQRNNCLTRFRWSLVSRRCSRLMGGLLLDVVVGFLELRGDEHRVVHHPGQYTRSHYS
jgi:hypothetical protein